MGNSAWSNGFTNLISCQGIFVCVSVLEISIVYSLRNCGPGKLVTFYLRLDITFGSPCSFHLSATFLTVLQTNVPQKSNISWGPNFPAIPYCNDFVFINCKILAKVFSKVVNKFWIMKVANERLAFIDIFSMLLKYVFMSLMKFLWKLALVSENKNLI